MAWREEWEEKRFLCGEKSPSCLHNLVWLPLASTGACQSDLTLHLPELGLIGLELGSLVCELGSLEHECALPGLIFIPLSLSHAACWSSSSLSTYPSQTSISLVNFQIHPTICVLTFVNLAFEEKITSKGHQAWSVYSIPCQGLHWPNMAAVEAFR